MAIIMRNGLAANFDPNKMRAGELAVVTDARELHATFAPGDSPKVLLDGEAVPNPETAGTNGQILSINEDGEPEWGDVGAPTDEQVGEAVSDWLDAHPEATTTVEDGAITYAKLDSNLKGTVDDVGELKSDISDNVGFIEELQETVFQKKKAILGTKKIDFYVPNGATLVFESELGFSRDNTINFFDATGTNIGYKSISAGGKTASYKGEADIYAMQVYYDAEPINVYYVTPNLGLIQKVNDLYRYPVASGIKSANLFTAWEVGSINYTTGVESEATNQLRSVGYIAVENNTEYTAYDPDRVSANARNAQYVIEYDANFHYVGYSAISTAQTFITESGTKYIRFASQYVGTNQYVIGDYANFQTMVYKGTEVIPYVSPYPVADRIDVDNTAYKMSVGRASQNLFSGSYVFGYPDANGIVKRDSTILTSPFIPVSGTVYYQLFGGKLRDMQYIFEYDANKTYISNSSLGNGATTIAGKKTLNANTAFVRFRTQTASARYTLPDIDFMNTHLVVSDKPIERFLDVKPNVSNDCVDKGFFDTAVQFKGFEYNKTAADSYIDAINNGAYDVVIPFITDAHTEQPQPYDLHNYLAASGFADVAFNLGDNIPSNYDSRVKAIQTLKTAFHEEYLNPRKCEVYVLFGNHDYNPYGNNASEYTINSALYYALSQARTKKGYAYSGKNYGYIDLNVAKVRVIWIDSADIFNDDGTVVTTDENTAVRQEQFTWFCNVALNFADKQDRSEWCVMTVSHDSLGSLSDGGFATVIKAFMDGTAVSGTAHCINRGTEIPQVYNVDFTSQGSMEYLCHICGHQHYDRVSLLGNTGRYQIWIACDNIDQNAGYYDDGTVSPYERVRGTISERCIDTFCLDKKTRTIVMKRLGVGSDRTITY